MSDVLNRPRPAPRWLSWWAVATVALTAVPVSLGGWVTTVKAGMADPVWPTTPWYLFFIDWREPRPGFIIEHAHRLAGYLIGIFVIVLAVGLWKRARSPVLRWLGLVALLAVIFQGMLGGFRVVLNELFGNQLATIHGTFAQVVFALLTTVAILTFPARPEGNVAPGERIRLRRLSLALAVVVFFQVAFGAVLRHSAHPLAQRLHLLTAFAVVALAVMVLRSAGSPAFGRRFSRARVALMGLLTLQLLLGVEAWLGKFPPLGPVVLPELQHPTTGQVITRILHVLVGAGVFATSVAFALMARLPAGLSVAPTERPELAPVPVNAQGVAPLGGTV